MEDARGGERLPNHVAGRDACANPHTKTAENAFDVIDRQDPRRDEPGPDRSSDDAGPGDVHGIDGGPGPNESGRRFDEPTTAEILMVSDIPGETNAACVEKLTR